MKIKGKYIIPLLSGILALLLYAFNDASLYINASYLLTFYFGAKLVQAIGKKIPFRELVLFISCVQYLFAPALDYQILGEYNPFFKMRMDQEAFFSYVMFAFIGLWFGLAFPLKKSPDEIEIVNQIKKSPKTNSKIGVSLIIIGLIANYTSVLLGSIPTFAFIITLLSLMRFIGLLYILMSDHKHKKLIITGLLMELSLSTLREAIFIQLIILLIFLYSYYALVKKLNKVKIMSLGAVAAVLLFFVQSIKGDYRKAVWIKKVESNKVGLFANLLSDKFSSLDEKDFLYTAARVNQRLNQGWVMQLIMTNLPARKPFLNGEMFYDELLGLVLPRFILIDKVQVQSSEKFERFVGYKLKGYTISVGILGDGYGNFGVSGGIIFCFVIGLFFNIFIYFFCKLSKRNPSLFLWGIFIFFYLIRAGDDFYIISNWLIKSSMMLIVIYYLFKKHLVFPYRNIIGTMVYPNRKRLA